MSGAPPTVLPLVQGAATGGTPPPFGRSAESHWRSLAWYNLYRLASSLVFLFVVSVPGHRTLFGSRDPGLFVLACMLYFVLCLGALVALRLRRPIVQVQLSMQIAIDTIFLAVLALASGGVRSGLGIMPLIALAAAGLVGRGRMVVFYAALASIAMLLQESWQVLSPVSEDADMVHAGLLCVGYFAVALLAHTLARYATESEQLAEQRGVDLANLGHVNQLIIDDMEEGVLVVDDRGRILQLNHATNALLGPLPLAAEHLTIAQYCPELQGMMQDWKSPQGSRFKLMRSPVSGAEMRVRHVQIGNEGVRGTLLFMEDISQERAQQRQIKLAALGRLTANIAHEIRNPLSAISHAAQLLQEERSLEGTEAMLLRIIRDNSDRLDRMVREVLQLNRRDRAQPEQIAPRTYLNGYVDEFCHIEKAEREVFSVEIDSDSHLLFDKNHLHQVLWNLTRNAWRHCRRRQGSIRLCFNRSPIPSMLQLDVIDDGPGVSPEMQGQLFEPFFTTENQGTGLGLYIARELCEANGASLDYVEVAPGGHFRLLVREVQ